MWTKLSEIFTVYRSSFSRYWDISYRPENYDRDKLTRQLMRRLHATSAAETHRATKCVIARHRRTFSTQQQLFCSVRSQYRPSVTHVTSYISIIVSPCLRLRSPTVSLIFAWNETTLRPAKMQCLRPPTEPLVTCTERVLKIICFRK